MDEGPLLFDGFDDCLIGWTDSWSGTSRVTRAVYDGWYMIQDLVDQGMTEEEATEYMEFNITGAYLGPGTPVIIWQQELHDTMEILEMSHVH